MGSLVLTPFVPRPADPLYCAQLTRHNAAEVARRGDGTVKSVIDPATKAPSIVGVYVRTPVGVVRAKLGDWVCLRSDNQMIVIREVDFDRQFISMNGEQ